MDNAFKQLNDTQDALTKKIEFLQNQNSYQLEGLVNVLNLLNEIQKNNSKFEAQIASIQRTVSRTQSQIRDLAISINNTQTDIDDLKNDIAETHSKLDTLDNDIHNIKIFKYVGGVS